MNNETTIWPGNVIAGTACVYGVLVQYAAVDDYLQRCFRWYRGPREGFADSMGDALAFARGQR